MNIKPEREKLIELLREVRYLGGWEEKIADYLIANGVMLRSGMAEERCWHIAEYDPPEVSGYYLCFMGGKRKICFFWHERTEWEYNGKVTKKVSHWTDLLAAPEDDRCSAHKGE